MLPGLTDGRASPREVQPFIGPLVGLFIVSAEKRPWMPTDDQLAEPFPARAVVRHKAAVLVRLPGTSYVVAGRTE